MNCKINLILAWSVNYVICFICKTNRATTFAITDTTFYTPVVTLSAQDNA